MSLPLRLAGATLLLLGLACAPRAAEPPGPPDGVYAMRGEIVRLPQAGGREVLIRHEAVPDLKDAQGRVVGMEAMTMSFALAPEVDRAQLAEGQRYSFTLEVRWDGPQPVTVKGFAPLPPGTRLGFDQPESAPPPG